jgi:membrane protein DedA with SNARE-associated domain
MFHHFFFYLISDAVGSTLLLSLAIMLCVILLEDATVIIVGVLAADGTLSVPVALLSLYAGMVVCDIFLYAVGSIARTHPRLARYADHEFTAPFRMWLESRYSMIIFSGHFVPGLRVTTYVASGFFRLRLSKYLPTAIASGLLLGTTLFTASYLFGGYSSRWLGEVRWGVAAVFIVALFLIARHNIVSYRARKDGVTAPR